MDKFRGVFEALGLSELEERIYNALIEKPRSTAGDLSRELEFTRAQIQRGLTLLRHKGFVSETPAPRREYMPASPEAPVEVLVHKKEEELHQARIAAAQLADRAREAIERVRTGGLLEILTGSNASAQRYRQLLMSVQEELLVVDRPPYAYPPSPTQLKENLEVPARGVKCRGIYARESLEIPGRMEAAEEGIAAGWSYRVLPDVGTKLVIVDRRVGLIPLNLEKRGVEDAVVVHASFLLHALVTLFESLWKEATPLGPLSGEAEDDAKSHRDQLLRLASAGLKDDSIARVLGQSRRTVVRRMTEVMDDLGAKTRFQAGVLAERRFELEG